jgi:hypothetical protein
MKQYLLAIALFGTLCQASTIKISTASLAEYKKTIEPFLSNKKQELKKLNRLPSGNSFVGMITNFVIESVVSPLLGYGNIDIERAKVFLGRSFADEKKLQIALQELENKPENLQFIGTIFSELPQQVVAKKDKAGFYDVMRTIKHPNVPNPKAMGDRDSDGNYIISDDKFYQLAATTFMAFHIFETNLKPSPKNKIL